MKERVHITEVGPRDGLQNEHVVLPSRAQIAFVERLVQAGARQIEVTSFVRPSRVPALADAEATYAGIERQPATRYLALVPNRYGYERARAVGCDAIAVFTATTDSFTRANIGMGVVESLAGFREIAARAHAEDVDVRGYVSTAFGCPYDGPTSPDRVLAVALELFEFDCYEISLGDTIGVATPADIRRLLDLLLTRIPAHRLALHLHDTWGMAVANAAVALDYGIRRFDSSAGGLGGCPYAPGASGNACTEDLIYLFEGLGYETGFDIEAVAMAAAKIATYLEHEPRGKAYQAILARGGTKARRAC